VVEHILYDPKVRFHVLAINILVVAASSCLVPMKQIASKDVLGCVQCATGC